MTTNTQDMKYKYIDRCFFITHNIQTIIIMNLITIFQNEPPLDSFTDKYNNQYNMNFNNTKPCKPFIFMQL